MRVDELDRHRSFADRGRAALDRAGADVACREHAGYVVCEQEFALAACPVRMKPSASRAMVSSSHSVHGFAPRNRKRKENGSRSPSVSVTASSVPSPPWSSAISLRSRIATP